MSEYNSDCLCILCCCLFSWSGAVQDIDELLLPWGPGDHPRCVRQPGCVLQRIYRTRLCFCLSYLRLVPVEFYSVRREQTGVLREPITLAPGEGGRYMHLCCRSTLHQEHEEVRF